MLYTSYYGNSRKFPTNAIKVSISLSKPQSFATDMDLKWLAPTWTMLSKYKANHNAQEYIKEYAKILQKNFAEIEKFLYWAIADQRDIILLCWEASGKFCHRHLFAEYANKVLGIQIDEL